MASLKKVIALILLYLQLMAINFSFLPLGVRSILGLMGLIITIERSEFRKFLSTRTLTGSFLFLCLWAIISFASTIANQTNDYYFISFLISQINTLFASIFLIYLFHFKFKYSSAQILDLVITVISLFVLSGILLFIFPDIKDLLMSITVRSSAYEEEFMKDVQFRLIGFGPKFFGAGVFSGLGLILITYKLLTQKISKFVNLYYILLYIIIFLGGVFASRTTIIGFFISIGMYVLKSKLFNLKNISFLIISVIVIFSLINYLIDNSDRLGLSALTKFGFEFIYNYQITGSVSTGSTNQLIEMIKIPKSFYTYILGNGLFTDTKTGYFYKQIDIGYLRMIYYSGIFSLLAMIVFFTKLIYSKILCNSLGYFFCNSIFIFFIIVYFKGVTGINSFIFLILGTLFLENYKTKHNATL